MRPIAWMPGGGTSLERLERCEILAFHVGSRWIFEGWARPFAVAIGAALKVAADGRAPHAVPSARE